ncbi:portal protein [Tardiphaga sp. 538_B7_N1_4]|uniref:portal protein n=1 Tax=Tardiphaga sp. 538_B7_N1_4 TaxID=3240778 RepID=UPI003F2951FD
MPAPADMMATAQPAPTTHDVTVVTTKKMAQAKVLGVPPEEFGIERNARDIKTCNYCFHEVVTKTETQLIEEGFDETQIKSLNDYTGTTDSETTSRDTVQEHTGQSGVNPATRLVKVTEHYVRMDYEGNGRACLYLVMTGGDQGEILKRDGKEVIEPIDVIPFATTTPVPVTHRFFGRSIADLVVDIQKIKTSLLRAGLDSKYLSSGADVEIAESHVGPSTIDDLLGPKRPGRVIRTKQPGGLNYQVVPDTSEASFAAMGYMDSLLEMRTGVTRQGQGVDADALQNQSATAVAQVFSASQARMKLIARIMAEGVRDMFALLHHTIRSHGQEQQTVRLRNTWVEVDPRNWKTRDDMTINVGLGTGGKAQQFAQTMALANFQKELILGGKTNLVDDQALFNTASELSKIMGHKNPDKFFNDPSEKNPDGSPKHPPPPPPVDPKMEQIKVQAQLDAQADERKAKIEELQANADIATQDKKIGAEILQSREEADLKAKLAILEARLDRDKFEREEARKDREHAQKMELARQTHEANMKQSAMGMVATAQSHDAKMQQMEKSDAGE